MDRVKDIFLGILVVIFLIYGWGSFYAKDKAADKAVSQTALGADIQEKIIFSPKTHSYTTAIRRGDETVLRTSYLSNDPASITVDNKGKVQVTQRTYGPETSPWVGFAFSDTARLGLGVDLVFFRNWNGGLALYPTVSGAFSVRVGPTVSYSIYSNTSLFVGITERLAPVGGISLRF